MNSFFFARAFRSAIGLPTNRLVMKKAPWQRLRIVDAKVAFVEHCVPGEQPDTCLSPNQFKQLKKYMSEDYNISRERMVELLNGDLSREYQAIIAYTIYSQTIKGAAFNNIASELEGHASEELSHAILLARQIDYLNGTPTNTPEEVKMSDKAEEMLQFDLENERQTIVNYRTRIRQADAMGEFALGEVLRKIIEQEQDHLLDLADALGIDAPRVGD
jgi:bacterioferritin